MIQGSDARNVKGRVRGGDWRTARNSSAEPLVWRLGQPRPQRIAVLRALQLGDLLCAVPALRALRAALPETHVTLICLPWGREFAKRFSEYIDDFLEFPGFPGLPEREFAAQQFPKFLSQAHAARFDLAIQMHGSGAFVNPLIALLGARLTAGYYVPGEWRPDAERFMAYPNDKPEVWRHLALMEFLGAPARGDWLEFPLDDRDYEELETVDTARSLAPGRYVCIHPGARYPSRRWGAERYAALADQLARRGFQVVVTGSNAEAALARELCEAMTEPSINLAGRTTLGALAALLSRARLLVSNDTGVSHVAAGLGLPSVVVVTGSDPRRWAPLDAELHPIASHRVDCQPCEHVVCPIGHPCASKLMPERVLAVVEALLDQTDGYPSRVGPAAGSATSGASPVLAGM